MKTKKKDRKYTENIQKIKLRKIFTLNKVKFNKVNFKQSKTILTHFRPLLLSYIPREHQKNSCILMFIGIMERKYSK